MRIAILYTLLCLFSLPACNRFSNDSGKTFGEPVSAEGAIPATDLIAEMGNAPQFEIKIKGKVLEVCQEEGCWMRIEIGNGESMIVRFTGGNFVVPKNIAGKEVILDGVAYYKAASGEEPANENETEEGLSKDTTAALSETETELVFEAKGALIL